MNFTKDELASIKHALDHLTANRIADEFCSVGSAGWYSGSRVKFIQRHKKAIKLLKSMLKQESVKQVTCPDGVSWRPDTLKKCANINHLKNPHHKSDKEKERET